jgi:hypothetical protein
MPPAESLREASLVAQSSEAVSEPLGIKADRETAWESIEYSRPVCYAHEARA